MKSEAKRQFIETINRFGELKEVGPSLSVESLALALGVSEQTVRGYIAELLPWGQGELADGELSVLPGVKIPTTTPNEVKTQCVDLPGTGINGSDKGTNRKRRIRRLPDERG